MEKLTAGQSLRSILGICEDSTNAISSPASPDGLTPCSSPDGPKIKKSGLGQSHVSRSRSPAMAPARMIHGTYGHTFIDSSVPVTLPSSWENRLVARLGIIGSTESALIWKQKDTPAGRLIYRLAQSTRLTNETVYIGSRWATPKASDGEGGRTTKTKGGGNSHLPIHVREATTWPTPTPSDDNLSRMKNPEEYSKDWLALDYTGVNLAVIAQAHYQGVTSGAPQSGCQEKTEKPGALNPQFACWLMGLPQGWLSCAPSGTPSCRKSQPK